MTEKWANEVYTNLDYPWNGAQAPTAFATGPISAETQGAWIVRCICYLAKHHIHTITATEEAGQKWKEHVNKAGRKACSHKHIAGTMVTIFRANQGKHLTTWQASQPTRDGVLRAETMAIGDLC